MHLDWRNMYPPFWTRPHSPPVYTSLTHMEAAELYFLAEDRRHVLEIGSAYGYSAITIATATDRITSVDPHTLCPDSLEIMINNLEAYRVRDRVTMYLAKFEDVTETFKDKGYTYDLIFIDGDHSYESVIYDVTYAADLLAHDGVLAVHDYLEDCCPDVQRALDEIFPDGPTQIVDSLAIYEGISPAD